MAAMNILLISDDPLSTFALKAKLSAYKLIDLTCVDSFADALNMVNNRPFFAIIYSARQEINNSESFVSKTAYITANNKTKYLVYLGNLTLNDVSKFNYEFEPRAQILSATINVEELTLKIAELIKSSMGPKKKYTIDVQMMNPFISATTQTLEMMCFCHNLTYLSPKIFSSSLGLNCDISGSLIMESLNFNGRLSICFNKKTFLKLAGNMLGETYTEITLEIEDLAAELTNIIYGQTKRVLSEKGYDFNKSIPKVIVGTENFIKQIGANVSIVIPFRCDEGAFCIIVTVHQ